jgi:hypothetical protein
VRISSLASTSTSSLPTQAQTSPSDSVFQALLASVSNDENIAEKTTASSSASPDASPDASTDTGTNSKQRTEPGSAQSESSANSNTSSPSLSQVDVTPMNSLPPQEEGRRVNVGSSLVEKQEALRVTTNDSGGRTTLLAAAASSIPAVKTQPIAPTATFQTLLAGSYTGSISTTATVNPMTTTRIEASGPANVPSWLQGSARSVANLSTATPSPSIDREKARSVPAASSTGTSLPKTVVSSNLQANAQQSHAISAIATSLTLTSTTSSTNGLLSAAATIPAIPSTAIQTQSAPSSSSRIGAEVAGLGVELSMAPKGTQRVTTNVQVRGQEGNKSTPSTPKDETESLTSNSVDKAASSVSTAYALPAEGPASHQETVRPVITGSTDKIVSASGSAIRLERAAQTNTSNYAVYGQNEAQTAAPFLPAQDALTNASLTDQPTVNQPRNESNRSDGSPIASPNDVSSGSVEMRQVKSQLSNSPQPSLASISNQPTTLPSQLDLTIPASGTDTSVVPTRVVPNLIVESELAPITSQIGETLSLSYNGAVASVVAKGGDTTQASGSMTEKKESLDPTGMKNSDAKSTVNAGDNKTSQVGTVLRDVSSHGSQNDGQTQKDAPSASSQPVLTAHASDSGTSQQQASPLQNVSHQSLATDHSPASSDNSMLGNVDREAQTSIHAENREVAAMSSIDTARLVQTMSASEMRVGMHSAEFGNISIRATVSQQQMLAQISVDHSDLSHAISAHLATTQNKLGDEQGLRALIEVNNQGASSADTGHSSQREQSSLANTLRGSSVTASEEIGSGTDNGTDAAILMGAANGNRLDIRA